MTTEARLDEALIWHIRLSDQGASADDWAAFTKWVEADVTNADAYTKFPGLEHFSFILNHIRMI